MSGQRLPTGVVEARGNKHFSKSELEERRNSEIKPITDNIIIPVYYC
jgi:hypothetical protein